MAEPTEVRPHNRTIHSHPSCSNSRDGRSSAGVGCKACLCRAPPPDEELPRSGRGLRPPPLLPTDARAREPPGRSRCPRNPGACDACPASGLSDLPARRGSASPTASRIGVGFGLSPACFLGSSWSILSTSSVDAENGETPSCPPWCPGLTPNQSRFSLLESNGTRLSF